jgi:hypothetical protein
MTKQHIDRLKELVLTSADLTEPIDYFIQHVSTDAEIVRASQPAASPLLLQVTLGLVERHCGQGPYVLAPLFLHAPAYQLWHGGCQLGGGYVTHLIYFDDVKTGILFIAQPQDIMNAKYVRFSLVPQSERTARS